LTSDSKPKVGFVGLGNMGGNMAARLLAAGTRVEVVKIEGATALVYE
jgi:3-hydroxyisobutyrate dehydrogenase-like beta-hydroxyacid dehydrogenase